MLSYWAEVPDICSSMFIFLCFGAKIWEFKFWSKRDVMQQKKEKNDNKSHLLLHPTTFVSNNKVQGHNAKDLT